MALSGKRRKKEALVFACLPSLSLTSSHILLLLLLHSFADSSIRLYVSKVDRRLKHSSDDLKLSRPSVPDWNCLSPVDQGAMRFYAFCSETVIVGLPKPYHASQSDKSPFNKHLSCQFCFSTEYWLI